MGLGLGLGGWDLRPVDFSAHLLAGRLLLAGHVARGPFAPTPRCGREATRRLEGSEDS